MFLIEYCCEKFIPPLIHRLKLGQKVLVRIEAFKLHRGYSIITFSLNEQNLDPPKGA